MIIAISESYFHIWVSESGESHTFIPYCEGAYTPIKREVAVSIAIEELNSFVQQLFVAQQVDPAVARVVSDVLVAGDRLGQHTHGVKLARAYLRDIRNGHAAIDPQCLKVLKSSPVLRLYDAHYLLGPYVLSEAIQWTTGAAKEYGLAAANIRQSHHIACLGAYLKSVVDQGLVCLIMSSDPAAVLVAPFGGTRAMQTPNPLALGVPGDPEPILIDVSLSSITSGMVAKQRQLGKRLAHPVLLTADGELSDDPETAFANPPSTILPLGGMEYGYKGFALGLMVEAMTSGIAGFGRKDKPTGWGASVYIQVIDPDFLGGLQALKDEVAFLSEQVRSNPPVDASRPPRMPGWNGMANWHRADTDGVSLPADVVNELREAAAEADLAYPF